MGLKRQPPKKIDLTFILDFYDAWVREAEGTKAAAALNTTFGSLMQWIEKSPELQLAKKKAEEKRKTTATLSAYIFQHLTPEAKDIWDRIKFWENSDDSTYHKINQILEGKSKRLRQEIFIHALTTSNFDLSTASRLACVSRQMVEYWKQNDLEFRQMIEEIQFHKKNFFERALLDLVELRYPGAVMFVNRTINADRGYNERLTLEHSGMIDTGGIRIEELDLDLETRKKVLEAIRKKKVVTGNEQLQIPHRINGMINPTKNDKKMPVLDVEAEEL